MIKFVDRVFLLLAILGINSMIGIKFSNSIIGFILTMAAWVLFWLWLDSTFISISYVREQIEKDKVKNDNTNSSSSDT